MGFVVKTAVKCQFNKCQNNKIISFDEIIIHHTLIYCVSLRKNVGTYVLCQRCTKCKVNVEHGSDSESCCVPNSDKASEFWIEMLDVAIKRECISFNTDNEL